ncbi:hypothetical protein GCM10007973_25970 [Polymorphobacter multimanifer]|uniref:Pilus assembly protein Flp/PilA n=1 Tax=Polymorphobacter multimanifer TaxID=1070431 RepID=A0A841L6L0_9SPHN|nr:Flp family type IVb pilin [Polymorphobacter multimanifer]MBB6226593.1 pilus assembly protein Flp/PilA [Polymorphobacter multimanifer]GGI88409.1 hypothetical protein GCM10007973_25970 [Polymorphobacter multimanifer]
MMKLLKNIKINKSGASAAEYALMLAVMGGIVVTAVIALGGGVSTAFTNTSTNLDTANAAAEGS